MNFAKDIRQEMEKRHQARMVDKNSDKNYYAELNDVIRAEEIAKEAKNRALKHQRAQEMNQELQQVIQGKKSKRLEQELVEKQTDELNQSFNDMKLMFNERRKQYDREQAQDRLNRGQVVGKLNIIEQVKKEQQYHDFVEKTSHSRDNESTIRQEKEAKKKQLAIQDQKEFQTAHVTCIDLAFAKNGSTSTRTVEQGKGSITSVAR